MSTNSPRTSYCPSYNLELAEVLNRSGSMKRTFIKFVHVLEAVDIIQSCVSRGL